MIARSDSAGLGTRVIAAASAVDLARGDPGEPDPRTLRAPDRAIAVPDVGGRAVEGLALSDDLESREEKHQLFAPMSLADLFRRLVNSLARGVSPCPKLDRATLSISLIAFLTRAASSLDK
jgi:hypothetical protein